MTHTMDLRFRENEFEAPFPPSFDNTPDPPSLPVAEIFIKSIGRDEGGPWVITPMCVTFKELNYHIDRLIAELEEIRKKAKQKFER